MVVMIIATVASISIFAINQAFDRRFLSEAENLHAWLQQLSERAALESAAYGVMSNEQGLQAVVFYRQRWFEVVSPELFVFQGDAVLEWLSDQALPKPEKRDRNGKKQILPIIAVLPGGYTEPEAQLQLSFEDSDIGFSYRWQAEEGGVVMTRLEP